MAEKMSRHWKEPYTPERAAAARIHDYEGTLIVGDPNSQWIYDVTVCGFTFTFFSIEMIRDYVDYYARKILPTSRFHDSSPFSHGAAASVGGGQSRFERLPGKLRKESKRTKVKDALEKALVAFESKTANKSSHSTADRA